MFIENYFIPLEPIESWCKKYNLKIKRTKCKICKKVLLTDTPFFTKDLRGLFSKECSCGNKNTPFTFIIIDNIKL